MVVIHDSAAFQSALNQAQSHLSVGRVRDASLLAVDLIRQHPRDPRPLSLMASVHLAADQPERALSCLEQALNLAARDFSLRIRIGQVLARLGRRQDALTIADQIDPKDLSSAGLADGLGTLYTHCDEPSRALPHFERAVLLDASSVDFRYNLATAQRMVGALDAAENSLDEVIGQAPHLSAAYLTRSDIRRQTLDRNHIPELLSRLAVDSLAKADRITLQFALAKELEDVGRYAESFAALTAGCALQRSTSRYDVGTDVDTLTALTRRHTAEDLKIDQGGDPTEEPIFIVGLPRSGTTLIESILAAHPDVTAPGELPAFPIACVNLLADQGFRNLTKLAFVEQSLGLPAAKLGRQYLAMSRPQTGSTLRFIDKLPLNYLYAGLIARALPNARIIAVHRDPMDTCYAMYKTLFTAAYPFTYDLSDLGTYYLAWRDLMEHWQRELASRWLVVNYEDVVADPAGQAERLLVHCRLSRHEGCLAYAGRQGGVSTASAAQVRQPIYRTSIGHWRQYATELEPLRRQISARFPETG